MHAQSAQRAHKRRRNRRSACRERERTHARHASRVGWVGKCVAFHGGQPLRR